jgi:kinetochore protein Nuf2
MEPANRTRLARAARVDDFNAKDLHHPERDRTLLILSAFINFIKFTEQFCETFVKELRDRSAKLLIERDQLLQEVEDVEGAIEELQYVLR